MQIFLKKEVIWYIFIWKKENTQNISLSQNMLIFYEKLCTYTNIHLDIIADISGFPGGSVVKNPPANAGDMGSIPGWGRSPGEGNGNPFQYSCLENPMDRRVLLATVHGVTKSQAWLKRLSTADILTEVISFDSFLSLFFLSCRETWKNALQIIVELEYATGDEMAGLHHQLNGHECEQTPGDGEGQGSQVCCSPWGRKESNTTEWLNNNKRMEISHSGLT